MALSKTYYNDKDENSPHLTIHRNDKGDLFICLSPFPSHSEDVFLVLPPEDAKEIISELAFEFDLINDDPILDGKMIWEGASR